MGAMARLHSWPATWIGPLSPANGTRARRGIFGDPFGAGQWRCLIEFAKPVVPMTQAANGFVNRFSMRNHRGSAGFGLVKCQLLGGDVRRIDLLVRPAPVMIEIHRAEEQQREYQNKEPNRDGLPRGLWLDIVFFTTIRSVAHDSTWPPRLIPDQGGFPLRGELLIVVFVVNFLHPGLGGGRVAGAQF